MTIESLLRLSPALPTLRRRSTRQSTLYGSSYIARSSISAYATVPPDPAPESSDILDHTLEANTKRNSIASVSPGRAAGLEWRKAAGRIVSRALVTALLTAASIGLPGFGRVMAFLGSFSAFLICIILPVSADQ